MAERWGVKDAAWQNDGRENHGGERGRERLAGSACAGLRRDKTLAPPAGVRVPSSAFRVFIRHVHKNRMEEPENARYRVT